MLIFRTYLIKSFNPATKAITFQPTSNREQNLASRVEYLVEGFCAEFDALCYTR